ncbi:sulfatase-like hydrolase/transferase [Granulosicoccus sp. 3-233]|uniref:sulfatase-like hydrolase/transferase n=1 Tax=Granulosicoccus sp. 3-233 TaxID=3417969 RepID=UPI003D34165A
MRKTRLRDKGIEPTEPSPAPDGRVTSGSRLSLDTSASGNSSLIAVGLSLLLLYLTLLFPGHPGEFDGDTLRQIPLEMPVIVLALLLVKGRAAYWLGKVLVLTLGSLLLLRLADLGSFLAFNRRFNPLLEMHLLADGWNLASTTIGPLEAAVVVLLMLLVLGLLAGLLYRGLLTIAQTRGRTRRLLIPLSLISLMIGSILLYKVEPSRESFTISARVVPEFRQRITSLLASIRDQQLFIGELQEDTVLDRSEPTFASLQGRDVILVFVESYGRGYLDAERFADAARNRLTTTENTLEKAGLKARSGWLTSPIRGGRSWLAHATLQSGLEVDNQARFDRLISTDRNSLSRLFQRAGWHTIGVMPAIQLAWPEGAWYGYESLHVAADMGYAGERFGYVTMPDQYTLSHFEQALRHQHDGPIMATLALLSTHAPWTPLPQKVDWDTIGDGSLFDGSQRFGEPISWKYRDRVQDMYIRSFDYTLEILGEYAAQFADDALIIVVGDHQPPPIINGWGASGDVPIHFISRDSSLLARLPDAQWVDGMQPDDSIQSQRMASLRGSLSILFE